MFHIHLPSDARILPSEGVYCATFDLLLAKRHFIPIRQENSFRNPLLISLAEWCTSSIVSFPALGFES